MTTAGERPAETMSFRADSLDAAVALAEESLGAPVRVVSANRIRRGGIGGFFASDLGVEVNVTLDDETIEQALERLVAESAVDERARWLEHRGGDASAAVASPTRSTAGLAAPRRTQTESIIEELHFLTQAATEVTAAPAATIEVPEARAVVVPTLPPRPADIARAAAANAAVSQALAVVDEQHLARRAEQAIVPHLPGTPRLPDTKTLATPSAAVLASPRPPWPAATTPAAPTTQAPMSPVAMSPAATTVEIEAASDAAILSQREVELAVAATDQLIESLQRETGTKRVSVRVVLRTGDQQAVEAEAEWEAS
ncbi:MAG: hypothetical protein HZB15_02810 [Actinobacteria bacterium]|nr:hypothetical protein [Actinomycetota bacterium]